MDKSLQNEVLDSQSAARRRFLTQAAAAGAVVGAAAALPALARENYGDELLHDQRSCRRTR